MATPLRMGFRSVLAPRWCGALAGVLILGLNLLLARVAPWQASPATRIHDDVGITLEAVHEAELGKSLYTEVAWPYGPLAIAPYILADRASPLTPAGYGVVSAVLVALGVSLLTGALASQLGPAAALAVTVFLCFPPWGAFGPGYFALEFALVTLLATVWVEPPERTLRRNVLLGIVLAALHINKFGTDVQVGLAVFALDVIALARCGANMTSVLLRSWRSLITGYLAGLLASIAVLGMCGFSLDQLRIALLPLQLLKIYHGVDLEQSLLQHLANSSVGYFLGVTVPALVSLAAVVVASRNRPLSGLAVMPWSFIAGSVTTFRLVFHYLMRAPYIFLALPLAWRNASRRFRAAALLCVPALLVSLRTDYRAWLPDGQTPVQAPNGQSLWAGPSEAKRLAEFFHVGDLVRHTTGAILASYQSPYGPPAHYFFESKSTTGELFFVPTSIEPVKQGRFLADVRAGDWFLIVGGDPTIGGTLDSDHARELLAGARLCYRSSLTPVVELFSTPGKSCPGVGRQASLAR